MTRNIMLSAVFIAALALGGCSRPAGQSQGGADLTGTITISGAWALYPLMVRWAEVFGELHPEVEFDISAGGAGKGMTDALSGAVDIGMVSRPIYSDELDRGAFWIPVSKDAVFLTVNEANPVREELYAQGVSREALVGIFVSGQVTTWGQVVGIPQLTDPIHVFTRSDACGAAATWAEYLGGSQEDLMGVGVYGDPGLLDAVVKDPLGIGYNNLNFAYDPDTEKPVAGALVIPLDVNQNGLSDSEEQYGTKHQAVEAVSSGHYPSPPARELNLVTGGKPTGLTAVFMRWILTDGQVYAGEVGYIGLAEDRLNEALEKLN